MNILLYILMFIPAVIMIIIGYAITEARKDSTMTSHHFAGNFNIKKYAKKVMTLFTFTGIIFSLGGILIISEKTAFGIAIMLISLVVFLVSFIVIQRKH